MYATKRIICLIYSFILLPALAFASEYYLINNPAVMPASYIITVSVLLWFVIVLVSLLLVRSRRSKQELERHIKERIHEFEKQASLLMAIFDSSADFIFCKDLESRYTHCNKSMVSFFNTTMEEVIGKTENNPFIVYLKDELKTFEASMEELIRRL